ncbi:ABC transporter ATP-binding protein [Runella sp.]|uniref:ABC transporter ATP-binding protein n=1 Tax=Runella sp. TaxID=1960881 RepID=UPI003D0B596F
MSFFQLNSVSKIYHHQWVIKNINFGLSEGEIFGLLGESGSGKSTLLRIAAGLLDADKGNVWLEGQKLRPASDQLIPGHPDIKIVHQDYNLSAPLTVRENINYALRYYEKAYRDERVNELLQLCQLEAVAEHPAKLLSGGEKQRTAIARALAEEAKVLLLDEPFAHLDLPNRHRLTETIRELAEQTGIACIFVTHDANDALSLSTRMGILKEGQLIQIGTPEVIYTSPADAYVAELTGEVNLLEADFFKNYTNSCSKLPDGRIAVRPEKCLLSLSPTIYGVEAIVKRVVFEGSHYKIYLQAASQLLKVYHHEVVPLGKSVFVDLKP